MFQQSILIQFERSKRLVLQLYSTVEQAFTFPIVMLVQKFINNVISEATHQLQLFKPKILTLFKSNYSICEDIFITNATEYKLKNLYYIDVLNIFICKPELYITAERYYPEEMYTKVELEILISHYIQMSALE
ncbi:Hypothetical_protein [Hexamita inflata]|uniref:Hypothetical_protein n=1 Tax=Hexamita inflata TaxID=28002 RepID=A0ABP1HUC4_9EUKA